MKKLKRMAIWIVTLLYLVLAAGFVAARYENQLCNRVDIAIEDSLKTGFLVRDDIVNLLEKEGISYLGIPLFRIDLDVIEGTIEMNQIVKSCKAYTGVNGTLHVDISQRTPYVRIIEKNGKGYYLDREGNILNLSSRYSPLVLVVNGNIRSSVKVGQPVNVNALPDSKNNKKLKEIFELTSYLRDNELWNSQFVQIYVNQSGEFEMVPRVGPHIIVLGPIDDYREKLDKLEIFYKEGLNNIGWNQYLKINLKYKDQVVCTKI